MFVPLGLGISIFSSSIYFLAAYFSLQPIKILLCICTTFSLSVLQLVGIEDDSIFLDIANRITMIYVYFLCSRIWNPFILCLGI